jgi:NAD(P)-dependent dehydrogenase (short-subunit alcohol dehydrogenase family)
MGLLAGHHALVTGGGTGIGAAIVKTLAGAGASVSIIGRRKPLLDEVASTLPKAKAIVADVTREVDCVAMVNTARAAFGPVDIVVANAGAAESVPFRKIDVAHWQRMLDVNLTGAVLTARAALADLTREAPDTARRIVFIASTAGLKGYPYVAAYCAAKHGVVGLARALSVEILANGVTVNAVCPGYTDTPLLEKSVQTITAKTSRSAKATRDELARDNPHGRLVRPEEVAQTVLWLCSPAAGSISGQAIAIAGGQV